MNNFFNNKEIVEIVITSIVLILICYSSWFIIKSFEKIFYEFKKVKKIICLWIFMHSIGLLFLWNFFLMGIIVCCSSSFCYVMRDLPLPGTGGNNMHDLFHNGYLISVVKFFEDGIRYLDVKVFVYGHGYSWKEIVVYQVHVVITMPIFGSVCITFPWILTLGFMNMYGIKIFMVLVALVIMALFVYIYYISVRETILYR